MNKHFLGYGASALLIIGISFGAASGFQEKNDKIATLQVEAIESENEMKVLIEEKDDVMSTNSQLSDKIESMEQNILELQEQLQNTSGQVESLQQKNTQLEKELQAKRQSKSNWMTFTATYYDADFASTGKSPGHPAYGVTATGEKVQDGVTVAVDPKVIPLGSWVEVKYPDGRVEKRKATDTGGAIKGKKIDIYIAQASYTSGKHQVKVRVLK